MVTVDEIVEFVQDKLDNGSLTDAWWDNFDPEFRALLAAALTRPTADLGEDGDIAAELQVHAWDDCGGQPPDTHIAIQAADRLILYREALERIKRIAQREDMKAPAKVACIESVAHSAVLSRSGG